MISPQTLSRLSRGKPLHTCPDHASGYAALPEEPVFLRVIDNLDRYVFGTDTRIMAEKFNSAFEECLFLIGVARVCRGQLDEDEIARALDSGIIRFEECVTIL